ncbi:collagen-like protein [Propionimicrobium sp. PCR01-08-3]|uniref:collagen-like triple helix repeat-containing protein n=1 Tax=Propionimicrobium sp. PCR01-08-3 TaxID=3052086 RepID=UPI00255D138D|nr:collagen-like protein [Propionimicrobium sp. PCR01-08-3]WIY84341.1 collagen-like protein [Propionimicrobium sp. PCR01-08-3]
MVQRVNLNPDTREVARRLASRISKAQAKQTAPAGVKDLGKRGDMVWTVPTGQVDADGNEIVIDRTVKNEAERLTVVSEKAEQIASEVATITDDVQAAQSAADQAAQDALRALQEGIVQVVTEWAVSSSETTAPTTGWSTTTPVRTAGTFIWERVTTEKGDGTSSVSAPVLLTGNAGAPGDDGAPGRGIVSSAVAYQASTSGTVVPSGTWQTVIPAVGASQFLWTRTIITYTDNSTTNSYSVGKIGSDGAPGTPGTPGAPGAPGKDGAGVSSITPYYILTGAGAGAPAKPTANPPGGSWTITEPAYTTSTALWSAPLTVKTDGTFSWGDVSKVSSYTAASQAMEVANLADASAKGLIKFSTTDPGQAVGRIWGVTNSSGQLIGLKYSNGTAWSSYTIMADQILVPGSAGTVSIADGAITAPKVTASEALLEKLLVRKITAGEIDVQDLLLSGQFKTAGFDEGQGVLIDQGGVVAKGTDADGNESLAILGSDGALTAVGANLVGGSLTINAEDGDATHFEEGFESGVISTAFKQPNRWLEVIESGFSAPGVSSTAHTGTKSLTMSHKRTVGNSLGSGSYIRNESKIQIELTGLNSSLSSYLLSFWLYIPNYKTYGDLRAVESKIQVLNWSQESGNFYYPSTSLSLSGSSLSDLGTGWVHIENVKLVAANTLRVIIKAELSLDNTSTPALPCYLDDVVIDGNFGQSSVRISSADGANIVWTDEVGAQIGKLGVNPALGTIKMTTPRLDTSQDVGLGGKLYIGNNSSMLFASPSQVGDLPDGTDLNYKTERGWFVTTENPVGIANSPVSGGFMLRVELLSPTTFITPRSGFLQTLVTPDGVTYIRSKKLTEWGKWGIVAANLTDWKIVPSAVGIFVEDIQVCKTGNLVSLRGRSPSRTWAAGWTKVGTIPAGYRPAAGHQVAVDVCENFGNIGCNAAIFPDDDNSLYVWTGGGTGTLVFGGSWIAEA